MINDIFTAISIAYLLCAFVYFALDDKPMFRLVGRQRTVMQAVMFVLGFLSVLCAAYLEVLK